MRGVQFTVAVTRIAARGDLTRFENPRQLMSYLGLTPSEYSSGERRRQGTITTAGHTFARRALIEGAWAYRDPAKVSRHLQLRLERLGSPGIAVMDHQYDRVKEHPGTMIAAQVHWGRRDGQFHSGAIELA